METKITALAIVPAAGSGRRMGPGTPKPFINLGGKPLIVHTLEALGSCGRVSEIIVAAHPSCVGRMQSAIKRYGVRKVSAVVRGGLTRSDSVRNCVRIARGHFDVILIHDAARPFVGADIIGESIKQAARHGGCVVAVPESDTVKVAGAGGFVKKTLDRSVLYRAQTPQAFRADVIRDAYSSKKTDATDDSSLAEMSGVKVKILIGSYSNIKITTRDDIAIGEAILARLGRRKDSASPRRCRG